MGEANAIGALAGVTCFNDVSMRDFQSRLPRITLAKNFDGSGPIGPWLVTMDEVGDIGALTIETRVNGEVMQRASTKEFIFPVAFIVDLISQACALHPGDVIATGTPAGVAWGRKPPNYLKDGDVVEVEIERVGTLRNVARAPTPPDYVPTQSTTHRSCLTMDFQLIPEQQQFSDSVRRWAEENLADGALKRTQTDEFPWDVARKMAEHGLLGITIPERDGGGRRHTGRCGSRD